MYSSSLLLLLTPCVLAFSTPAPTTNNPPLMMDTEKAFAESTFPIKPDDLLVRAREVMSEEINLGMNDGGECLAEDFEFAAAVVGPIGKSETLKALETFKLQDNFDITPNTFGLTVSPVQPNRVYYFTQQTATQVKDFMGAKVEDAKEGLVLPPQCHHIDFNEEGQIKEFGFYTVDRQYGNTGGLGGAFAYFYGVGKPIPIPECQPYKPSKRLRFLTIVGKLQSKFAKKN